MEYEVIRIVIVAFGLSPKAWKRAWLIEIIQSIYLLRSSRILRRVLETWGDLLSLRLQWKAINKLWCKKELAIIIIIIDKKENLPNSGLCRPGRPESKKEKKKPKKQKKQKKDKGLDLTRELKKTKQWIIKVTVIPTVIGALGTVTKALVQGLEDLEIGRRVETIQTTALLRSYRILSRVLETWEDLLSLKLYLETIC